MALAWCDGQFVEKDDIRINPTDYGFARGMALFEFGRIYNGVPFRLIDHIGRLLDGAKLYGIGMPWAANDIADIVHRLVAQNRFPHSTVKFYLTVGECHNPGPSGSFVYCTDFTPHLMIMEDEVHPKDRDAPRGLAMYQKGIKVKTVPFARQLPTAKSINYAPAFIAAREWGPKGWDEIMFVGDDGLITETATSNFFAVIDGVLCTPQEGMLLGVTRKVLLERASHIGLPFAERAIRPSDLAHATEAFVTGSFAEMLPVKQVDDYVFPTTMEGPVFTQLRRALTDYITASCRPAQAAEAG